MINVQATNPQGGPTVSVFWDGTVHHLSVNGSEILGSTTAMWEILRVLAFALDARVERNR